MPKQNTTFVVITFRASREPVEDMFWAEAQYDGAWTNVVRLERIKTRREILERIAELESAIIGIDAPYGFPKPFGDLIAQEGITGDWKQVAHKVREDLKKNTEDGIKLWVEKMGRYRELNLESEEEASWRNTRPVQNKSGRRFQEPRAPYELLSKSERFRRIDQIVRRISNTGIESTLGIRYNKLTSRYDFLDSEAQGRRALMCISLLSQLLEQNPDVCVWPFMKPGKVTVAEIAPALFPKLPRPQDLVAYFDKQEDSALYVDKAVTDTAASNKAAMIALHSLLGIISAERRENKAIRPLRDYRDNFYENELVKSEGWTYGIGYRDPVTNEAHPQKEKREKVAPVVEQAPVVNEVVAESVAS
jgi:hypothetical protein